ncbi:MAG: PqqD family protein [Alphaproteobacteria bacterium]
MTVRLVRNPVVGETPVDDEMFLVEPDTEEVYWLDGLSTGLWRLLADPVTLAELQDTVREAFPEAEATKVDADVESAVAELRRRRLVVELGDG